MPASALLSSIVFAPSPATLTRLSCAESREAAETRVCEIITNAEPYLFAWIGEVNPDTNEIECRASAGVEEDYLNEVTITADETPTGQGPGGKAIRERSLTIAQNVQEDLDRDPWKQKTLERGYQAIAAIPLEYDDTLYGALGVYADRPHAFDDTERDLLSELGDDIAHSMNSFAIQEQLREERDFIDQALDTLDCLFFVVGPDGELRRWNERLSETTGYTDDDIADMEVADFFPEEEYERVTEAVEETLSTGYKTMEADLRTIYGDRIPYEFTGARLTDSAGDLIGFVGIGRDISEREDRKRELTRQNERLKELVSVISHDLQSPLNVAEGQLKLAREECDSDSLDAVADAHDRMNALIDDLLTLAREGGQVGEVEPIDLGGITETCWRNVATPDATFRIEIDRAVRADRSRLSQLLENLIRNAIEHSDKDVTITVGELTDGFYIEDDGPGIPKDERDDVFDAGYSTADEGTGLGLSIVKQVADAHDWDLHVTERTDGGARFEITGMERVEPIPEE